MTMATQFRTLAINFLQHFSLPLLTVSPESRSLDLGGRIILPELSLLPTDCNFPGTPEAGGADSSVAITKSSSGGKTSWPGEVAAESFPAKVVMTGVVVSAFLLTPFFVFELLAIADEASVVCDYKKQTIL